MYARVNGNSIQKIRQKVLKQFFYQIIGWGHGPFWPGGGYSHVRRLCCDITVLDIDTAISPKIYVYYFLSLLQLISYNI